MHRARDLIVCFWDLAGGGPVCNAPTVADKGSTMTRRCMTRRASHAFTLIEAVIVVALAAMLVAMAIPAFDSVRTDARLAGSVSNLATLGKANAGYAALNNDRISGYDWDFDDGEFVPPGGFGGGYYVFNIGGGEIGPTYDARNRLEIAQVQQAATLRRATGRFGHPTIIWPDLNRLPYRRYLHVPLMDWLAGSVTDPLAVSPLDVHQQLFQQNPLDYENLPGGVPEFASDSSWTAVQTVNRWPFASSYQSTVYAWSPSRPLANGSMAVAPAGDGTLTLINEADALTPQQMTDVAFPSNKAHLFEEFDYRQGLGVNGRYFADPQASVNVLFFDGSARLTATEDANPGWYASEPCDMTSVASVEFDPIDTRYYPAYPNNTYFNNPYRWTRGGLEGIDVGAGEINTENRCE